MDDRKMLIEAVSKDIKSILTVLKNGEGLKAGEQARLFRQINDIAKMGSDLCGAFASSNTDYFLSLILTESEHKAPLLYAAIKDRAFRGESALRKQHDQLAALHTDIKLKMMGIQGAKLEDKIAVAELKVQELRAEQEKLMNMSLPVDTQEKALPKPRTRKKKEGEK